MSPARTKRAAPTVFRNQDTGDKLNRPLADFSDDLHKRLLALENSRIVRNLDFTYNVGLGSVNGWPQRISLPDGFTPKCVIVGGVWSPTEGGGGVVAAVATGVAWHVDGGALCVDYITGLTNNKRWIVTLEISQ